MSGCQKKAEKTLTLIHIGDIHGHMIPRPNVRSDGDPNKTEGGLARIATKIKNIRERVAKNPKGSSLLINTGDTIQGSAEALYTRGQALVTVLNTFKIDFFAPGNWEFVYGTERFLELFSGPSPVAPWTALAANVYYDGQPPYNSIPVDTRVLDSHKIVDVDGIQVGVIGFTTERGPRVIGAEVVQGFKFSKGDSEMAELVPLVRPKVDVLIVISELGLANNIRLAKNNPGVDVILSSDMHEITSKPVVLDSGTVIIEQGQDGTRLGELKLFLDDANKLFGHQYLSHKINSDIPEDSATAALVAAQRAPMVQGTFQPQVNPINGTTLTIPIDTVIGYTEVALHRSNFSDENMPAVIEGSSHDFLADVFREMTGADVGVIRGFRYGTHIAGPTQDGPGPIKLEDIYHYVAIGPFIASGQVSGQAIKTVIENSTDGSLNTDPSSWKGGWLFGWSGLKYDLDPYQSWGNRASNIRVWNKAALRYDSLDLTATYSLAGYNYDSEPNLINKVAASNVVQVTDPVNTTQALDGTMVVAEYLKVQNANPELNRINLLELLPAAQYGNPEVQPLGVIP